jgi:soluble lytic murein transglycosylase-like protein
MNTPKSLQPISGKVLPRNRFVTKLLCAGVLVMTSWSACAFSQEGPDRCVAPAAQYHKVNDQILAAILRIESRMNEKAINRNSNGSMDVGIAGTNSIHFNELARHGIAPENLLDACVATYVAAWDLSKKMARFGNNWFGIAAYHSATPYYNNRYQLLIYNELVSVGVLQGRRAAVPPLRPAN